LPSEESGEQGFLGWPATAVTGFVEIGAVFDWLSKARDHVEQLLEVVAAYTVLDTLA